jgi:hypothetical protein
MSKNGEFVNHLILHCEIASALWSVIFNRVGLAWVMLESSRPFSLLESARRQSSEHSCVEDSFVLPFAMSWEGKK